MVDITTLTTTPTIELLRDSKTFAKGSFLQEQVVGEIIYRMVCMTKFEIRRFEQANCSHVTQTFQPFSRRGYHVTRCTKCGLQTSESDSTD